VDKTEKYYSFKYGWAAGVFARSSTACYKVLEANKDEIVAKYTAVNRKSSSRRILDESIYYLPEINNETVNDTGISLLTHDPNCLFCI